MANEALPYNPISRFYRDTFNTKVYKISVSVAETCPNREGLKGMQTCNFCDQWGSAAYKQNLEKPLSQQIEEVREVLRRKRGADKFLVYFQAYTTTFARVSKLREQFELALSYPDVVGIVVGTRPDCISQSFIETCNEMAERGFMAVEFGVQSFDNDILKWMRRGHTAEQSLRAIQQISAKCPKVNLGIHLIFGCPGETDQMIIETALRINDLPLQNVKLHHMHVLKDTPLAEEYARGEFVPVEQEEYFRRCTLFLQHLREDIAVHRLSALSSRWDELVAPAWSTYKMETYQKQIEFMKTRGAFQGQLVGARA
ncbi:MAG: TIGR01212 family radical SAM protein [Bdellovibrionales bacterium]|nr:TIGR01212 family radical SAM protein [Bdellovibrionales bacterium]